jgi:hypothetical protein
VAGRPDSAWRRGGSILAPRRWFGIREFQPARDMQFPEHPNDKPLARKEAQASPFSRRLDRAAGDLNAFLVVLTIGLMVLDLSLYLGMAVSREPFAWRAAQQFAAPASPGGAAAGSDR